MTERMDDRALRLKTLGNAVCPPQAYPIFRYIAMIENGTCGDFCPYIKHHSRAVLLVIGIGACVALLFGGVSSCSMMAGSGVGGVFTSSYLSEDTDMLAAEAAYCELEQELQYELDHYEALHPGYDEYRFDLDEIKHDPYVLISILTAFHEGVLTIGEVQAELQMLFEKQYILTQTVEAVSYTHLAEAADEKALLKIQKSVSGYERRMKRLCRDVYKRQA